MESPKDRPTESHNYLDGRWGLHRIKLFVGEEKPHLYALKWRQLSLDLLNLFAECCHRAWAMTVDVVVDLFRYAGEIHQYSQRGVGRRLREIDIHVLD